VRARTRGPLFKRSAHVVCYWKEGRLVFENYATRARLTADPLTCEVLDFFDEWQPVESLAERLTRFSLKSLRQAVRDLAEQSLLERSDRPRAVERLVSTWGHWNPHAGFLHFSTKDLPYATVDVANQELQEKARSEPPPPPVPRRRRTTRVRLPAVAAEEPFPRVLLARRTWRRFGSAPVSLDQVARLLGLTWGVQGWMDTGFQGRVPLKTSPSGGARHPIEVYVLARQVTGLAPGLYHYEADRHQLGLVKKGATSRQLASYLPTQWWYGEAAALFLMTAVVGRSRWRYDFPRGYRAVLAEAGHLCQTFLLVATWLGLAPFCSMALADSRIEHDVGADGASECALYAAGVGTRPAGVTWAPRPPDRRPRRI